MLIVSDRCGYNTGVVIVHSGYTESTNLVLVSHFLTPVTEPTGLRGQQNTEFSQLGSHMPPHRAASSTPSQILTERSSPAYKVFCVIS